jgi:hypothetical protein
VCVCVCVCAILSSVARCTDVFHIISQTARFSFKKKLLNKKCVFWLSLQLLSQTFLILRWTERELIINVYCSSCSVLYSCQMVMKLLDRLPRKYSNSLLIPTSALRSLWFIRSVFQHHTLKTCKTHFLKILVKNVCGSSLKFQHVSDNVCPSTGSLKCSWLKLPVAYRLFPLCW